jgi:Rrf2 family protein
MRISLQVHYAICGIFDLAYNGRQGYVRVGEIGERQGIPTRYLEQIFQRLRRAELIVGKRGPGGGYELARPPAEINLRQVVEAVEGPLAEAQGWAHGLEEVGQNRPDFLWPEIAEGFARVLSDTTLENLCAKAARASVRRSNSSAHSYQI